jgi:hypothetical protein
LQYETLPFSISPPQTTDTNEDFLSSFWYTIDMNSHAKKREKITKQAVANERLEGLKVSREARKIADSYITGKASAKSVAAKIRARYGNL